MFKRFNASSPWVWMSAGMLSLCLIAVLGVMSLIGWKGLMYFWPTPIYTFEIQTENGVERFFGQIYQRESVSTRQLLEAGVSIHSPDQPTQERWLIKIANKENETHDFLSVLKQQIVSYDATSWMMFLEREQRGALYGIPEGLTQKGQYKAPENIEVYLAFQQKMADAKAQIKWISQVRLPQKKERLTYLQSKAEVKTTQSLLDEIQRLEEEEKTLRQTLARLTADVESSRLFFQQRDGSKQSIDAKQIADFWFPNDMSFFDKLSHWAKKIGQFITDSPKEANSEGGVFPAIFGTVLMVLLMSVVVMPLGVLAAVYLHEYAKQNMFTRMIRLSVVNLAGVPSIVYGVFGLGFFVYFLGENVDALFYDDVLPRPTFGTPGLLWSSLTLAMLTLPVVIVSTEEGLKRIPVSLREASFSLGATKAETLRNIILPMASPAMMTGLVLAIARAAGEVAPLMLVGVVKVAPSLPLDNTFPYLHLDRKFMHLGYHIFDAGFQSPNSETAKPLVYATSLLLVTVVVSLNLTAISIRHHLREKYRALEQDN